MNEQILEYREKINQIDEELLTLLEKRMNLSIKIGKIKRESKIPIENKQREKEILDKLKEKSDLNKELIEGVYQQIFKESKKIQI